MSQHCYYEISQESGGTYEESKTQLLDILDRSVQRRLVADVPLGAFLSEEGLIHPVSWH